MITTLGRQLSCFPNGSQTVFTFPHALIDAADLVITEDGVVQTAYVVSAITDGGATVTFTSPPTSASVLLFKRTTPLNQLVDYVPNESFNAETHEDALDKLTLLIQEYGDDTSNVVGANALLYWEESGTIFQPALSGYNLGQASNTVGDAFFSGQIHNSSTAGVTAGTTQTQAGGTALTTDFIEVSTVANANDAVTLPTAIAGTSVTIVNNGANTLKIFPAASDNLGLGVDTSTTLAAGVNVKYYAYDATNWELVATSAAGSGGPLVNWEESGTTLQPTTAGYAFGAVGNEIGNLSSNGTILGTTAISVGTATAPQGDIEVQGSAGPGVITLSNDAAVVGFGTILGQLSFYSYDTTYPGEVARVQAMAEATYSSGNAHTALVFYVNADGPVAPFEAGSFDYLGNLHVGNPGRTVIGSGGKVNILKSSGAQLILAQSVGASAAFMGFYIDSSSNLTLTNASQPNFIFQEATGNFQWGIGTHTGELGAASGYNYIKAKIGGELRLGANGVENQFVIDASGNASFTGTVSAPAGLDTTSAGSAVMTIGADSDNNSSGHTADLLFDNNGGTTVGRIRWQESDSTLNIGYGAADHLTITSAGLLEIDKTTADTGFLNCKATIDADATSAISSFTTSAAVTHHIQIQINGTTAWIPISTTDPTA